MIAQFIMTQFIMVVLLFIFALGGSAIVFCLLNIFWRSYFSANRKYQQVEPQPIELKVIARDEMSARHFSVRLQAMNGEVLTDFLPGQYLSLMVPSESDADSASSALLKRCYSLASWQQGTDFYELGIQREVEGKVSTWLHDNLQLGSVISALPPKGNFVINGKQTDHTVLIAGGIGITPLRAMVHQFICQIGENQFGKNKSMSLFYCAKSIAEMCYVDEFIQLADECSDFMFYPFLTQGVPAAQFTAGRLSAELLTKKLDLRLDKLKGDYYLCGPNAMMDELKVGLTEQGIAADHIHFERFGIEAATFSGQEYSVRLNNNKSIVFNKQRTLLDAMEAQGVELQSECRSGECGQCKVSLLAGKVKPLIKIEIDLKAGQILPCCSIPQSDLLIDV
ncbi:MAG: 2Fe-2S iron-sulfur cluster binding domain-containing protein [Oleispira sp.]|nr:2Fe-2S iron-sulfur cluster binding domain-containing protein [Oleispira sp.]